MVKIRVQQWPHAARIHSTKEGNPMRKSSTSSPSAAKRRREEREITRLHKALRDERRRSAVLEREVADLRRALSEQAHADTSKPLRRLKQRVKGTHKEERLLEAANRRAHHYRKGHFLRYLWETVMESSPVQVLANLIRYLRRVRAVHLILTILLALGAVVTVAVVWAALLPFLLAGTALLAMLSLLRSRRMNRILKNELTGKRIRVFVPPRGRSLEEASFFVRNARTMAADGVAVVVVSPYLLSSRGLGGKGGFFTARREAPGLYLARRHYFFFLRRRVLDAMEADITMVY